MRAYERHFLRDVLRAIGLVLIVVLLALSLQVSIRAATRIADGAAAGEVLGDVQAQLATRVLSALPLMCALGFALALWRWTRLRQTDMAEAVGFSVKKVVRWGACSAFVSLAVGHLALAPLAGGDWHEVRLIERNASGDRAVMTSGDGSAGVVESETTNNTAMVTARYFSDTESAELQATLGSIPRLPKRELVIQLAWLLLVVCLLPFALTEGARLELSTALAWPLSAWAVWIISRRVGSEILSVSYAESLALGALVPVRVLLGRAALLARYGDSA